MVYRPRLGVGAGLAAAPGPSWGSRLVRVLSGSGWIELSPPVLGGCWLVVLLAEMSRVMDSMRLGLEADEGRAEAVGAAAARRLEEDAFEGRIWVRAAAMTCCISLLELR